jgi:lipopolysaccharide transport system ATP-binding protein
VSALAAALPAECLIEASGVSKKYCRDFRLSLRYAIHDVMSGLLPGQDPAVLRTHEFWAVRDVSLTLRRGESLGVIGSNGAGKSTLLKMLTGQRTLTAGRVVVRGRVVAMTELGLGFDPVLTGRENAYVNAAVFGVPRAQVEPFIDAIIDFAGLRELIDSSVQTYSSGMKARLGFAVAAHLNPDILVVDEVLAVGDFAFRRKCVEHVRGFLLRGGSMILVAHDPGLIQSICNRCLVLESGRVIFDGAPVEGVDLHFQMGQAPAPDGPGRPGPTAEQPIVVEAFEVAPEGNGPLATGGPAIVTLRCRSLIEAKLGWGFSICTGNLLSTVFSCALGLEGGGVPIHRGLNEFRCRIPSLPLRPAVYAIRGGVSDSSTNIAMAVLGYQDAPSFFTVGPDHVSRTTNFQADSDALISVPVEWLD